MAFIGDAALTSDPLFGVGCGWALQSAEWLADTVGPALAAESYAHELGPALERYAKLHRARLGEHHKLIADGSSGRRFNALERALFRGATRDRTIAHAFMRFVARIDQPKQLLTPATMLRLARTSFGRHKAGAAGPRSHSAAADAERPVVLQKFLPAWGLPDLSPFCFKAEVYLKLAGIPYTTQLGDSRKAPKGKLPVLLDGERTIADSSMIVDYLERTRGKHMDAFLSAEQTAILTAVKAMLEEQLYFVIVYLRWRDADAWKIYQPVFFDLIAKLCVPTAVRRLVVPQIRNQMLAALRGQGMGRHTPEEFTDLGKRTIDAVSTLCIGPFFFGAKPSTLDATVYAFIESIRSAPFEGPLVEHLRADQKLRDYCEHMQRVCAVKRAVSSDEAEAGSGAALANAAA
jgi:glutathione S-transferase